MSGADGAAPTDYTLAQKCQDAYKGDTDALWQVAIDTLRQTKHSDIINARLESTGRNPLECAAADCKYVEPHFINFESAKKKTFLALLLQNPSLDLHVEKEGGKMMLCAIGIARYCDIDPAFRSQVAALCKGPKRNSNLLQQVWQLRAPFSDHAHDFYKEKTVVGSVATDDDYDGQTVNGNNDVGNLEELKVFERMDTTAESSFIDRCNVPKGQRSVYAAGLKLSKRMLPLI